MNDIYRYDVTFVTDQPPELVTSAVFGMPACLTIKSPGHDPRVIQGVAASIEALGGVAGEQASQLRRYTLTIVPRLWLLRHRRQNRIFQNKSIPEIVSKVLAGAGMQDSDCHWRADKKAYPPLPFVYQRGETDYDFFRRILASAGIFFFYEHASGFLDSMFGGAASAVAGAVGAAADMIGGAIGAAVSTVESATGMVPVLCFGDEAGHTAAVAASALGGLADEALHAGLDALAGAIGGVAGEAIEAVASAVEEPSDTLAFDDDQGSNAQVERVYQFEMKKTLRTKELRMLDRDVETAQSWVGVARTGDATASLNLSVGLSLAGSLSGGGLAGGLSAGVSVGASFDVDAPTIPASELRQELYQTDHAVWQDTRPPGLGPWVSLSAGQSAAGMALPQATIAAAIGNFNFDGAKGRRMRVELERTRRKYQEGGGKSDCRRMGAGYRFTLASHPIKMLNGEYTVTALDVEGVHPDFLEKGGAVYRNRFRCIPSSVAARPKRPKRRPKPGMEVARVVDYSGGQDVGLEANPAGYVRVRFRWDILDDAYATPRGVLRLGSAYKGEPHDDPYSVWLPVVQPWAGAGYGAQFIPREGMEVLVGFLEDQSERPVILGCLYSNENQPPWPEYIDHQKVGIRSQTRPANGGWSELSIDDRQDNEVVRFRAQRDMYEDVINDHTQTVGVRQTVGVGADQSIAVGQDRMIEVQRNQSHKIHGDTREEVAGTQRLEVKRNSEATVHENASVTIGGRLSQSAGERSMTAFGDHYLLKVAGDMTTVVGEKDPSKGNYAISTKRSFIVSSDDAVRLFATKAIELACGDSCVQIKPDGVRIKAKSLVLEGASVSVVGNGPALHLTDDAELVSKSIRMLTTQSSIILDQDAKVKGMRVLLNCGDGDSRSSGDGSTVPETKPFSVKVSDPDFKPYAGKQYVLVAAEKRFTGTVGADGTVEQSIPKSATSADLTVWEETYPTGPRRHWAITIADTLPPASEIAGVETRLANLGYRPGKSQSSEKVSTATRAAIAEFQTDHDLPATGEVDASTLGKLNERHAG
jgi:type VI secretion system secreted protein VgrG